MKFIRTFAIPKPKEVSLQLRACSLKGYRMYAEIAQLVEHDLAKVGVASSSLVFRSMMFSFFHNMKFFASLCVLYSEVFL